MIGEDWMDYDDRYDRAVKWCNEKAQGEYAREVTGFKCVFKFQKQSDAVHFGLLFI